MRKQIFPFLLCVTLLILSITAYAAEPRAAEGQATLSFDGTTAICTYRITSPGKAITVNMELWRGSVLVDSWSRTAMHTVSINESCAVTAGTTYTLKIGGTCGNDTINTPTITKTCPR